VKEISIGEFARRSRLSLKALRLYDERGVLVPARVDQGSGYRYYGTAQLEEARLVVMLRQLQLPLAAIRELLACDPADAAHDARRALADYLNSSRSCASARSRRPKDEEARSSASGGVW
jgi:DNA-binding transcriptional MerR regulator